jgi:general stress protein 26
MSHPENDDAARMKVREMVKDIRVAMLVTSTEEGHLRARPMYVQHIDGDGHTAWMFSQAGTSKHEQIAEESEVLLAFSDPSHQNYVSIRGTARTMHDPAKQKELWSEGMRTWFPNGAEDPKIRLIAVHMEGAEYWDSINSTVLHAYGYLKAIATGRPPEGGENAKVSFA